MKDTFLYYTRAILFIVPVACACEYFWGNIAYQFAIPTMMFFWLVYEEASFRKKERVKWTDEDSFRK